MRRVMILLLALFGTTVVHAGHGDVSIREAAYKLDKVTSRFYQRTKYEYGHGRLSYQARDLARATHRFCEDVERGVHFRRLSREFEHLKRRYHKVEHKLAYAARHDRHHGHYRGDYRADVLAGLLGLSYGRHDGHRGLGFGKVSKWMERLDRAMYREHKRYTRRHHRDRHDRHDDYGRRGPRVWRPDDDDD